jgi:prevent-host-death family protein
MVDIKKGSMTIYSHIMKDCMKTSTIADAKTHLTKLIYHLESGEAIHLTRHGRPVAVMLSEANYQKLIRPSSTLFSAIEQWRCENQTDAAFTETELHTLRKESAMGREFSWE